MPPKKKAFAVRRKGKTATKPVIKKKAPPLPKDWPVQSRAPKYPEEASALRPGTLLRETCSGQDIHLARGAVVPPNLTKEKGRYLVFLPGILNFKSQTTSSQPKSTQEDEDDNVDNADNNNDKETNKTKSLTGKTDDNDADNANKKQSSNVLSLGRMEAMSTDEPLLKIPFSNGRTLVFPGKKVPTTSKYIMLSCSARKKGSVTCKSIFSSAIVFGKPKWVSLKSDMDTKDVADMASESTEKSQDIVHYGGSERTVDGIARGKRAAVAPTESKKIPIYSKDQEPSAALLPMEEDDEKEKEVKGMTWTDDQSSDDEEFVATTFRKDSVSKRASLSRRASTQKAKYTQSSSEEEDSAVDEDSEKAKSNIKPSQITKSKPMQKASTADFDDYSSDDELYTLSALAKKKAPAKEEYIVLEESDNDFGGDEEESITLRPVSSRRSAGKKMSYKEVENSDVSEVDSEEDNFSADDDSDLEVLERAKPKIKTSQVSSSRTPTARKSSSSRKSTQLKKTKEEIKSPSSTSVLESATTPASDKKQKTSAPSRKRKVNSSSSEKKTKVARSKTAQKVEVGSDISDNENNGGVVNVDEQDSQPAKQSLASGHTESTPSSSRKLLSKSKPRSTTPASVRRLGKKKFESPSGSPFRSRRKKSAEKKTFGKSPAKKVLDLTQDDDPFNFG